MTRKTRLMHVTQDLGVGGLEQVVVTLCRVADRSRFDVSVLCLRDTGPLARELERLDVPVFRLPSTPGRTDYLGCLKAARILREQRIEVVHTHNTHALIDGGIGARLAGARTIVHTDHARQFPDKLRYMVAEHLVARMAAHVVGVSEHTARNLMEYERIPRRKVVVIPNGIDGSLYQRPVDRERKRRELGVAGRGPVLGIAARLTEEKGLPFLLRALALLKAELPGATLLIAGEGALQPELERVAAELGVRDDVRFLGLRADVPELLQVFDLFVLSSVSEGLPMALLEAMAAGCPVVATDVGGVGTAIRDGVNGALVKPRRPDALAAAIRRLWLDGGLRARYREAGRRIFRERYSAAAMAQRYEALYLAS